MAEPGAAVSRWRRSVRNILLTALPTGGQAEDVERALRNNGYTIVPIRPLRNPTDHHRYLFARDGEIGADTLMAAATEFDEISPEGERYTAVDFVAWFLPEVVGTREYRWMRNAAADRLMAQKGPRLEDDAA